MLTPRQLLIPVAAALLPVALFAAVILALFDRQERQRVEQQLTTAAAVAAGAVDRQLQRELSGLLALASSESLDSGDFIAFDRHARRAVASHSAWLSVVLTDRDRLLVNTRLPPPAPDEPVLYPDQITQVIDRDRTVISGVLSLPGRMTEPVVALRVPVRRDGAVRYALSAAVSPTLFLEALAETRVWLGTGVGKPDPATGEGRVLLVDRSRRIVARMPTGGTVDLMVGRPSSHVIPLPDPLPAGVMRTNGADGSPLFIATATAPASGWTTVVALPEADFTARRHRTEWLVHGGALAALLLAVVLAVVVISALVRRQETERRLEALNREKETERRLSDIAANLPGVVFRREQHPDGVGWYTYLSDGIVSALNLPDRVLATRPVRADDLIGYLTPDSRARWAAAVADSARTLEPMRIDGDMVDRDGRTHRFRSQAAVRRMDDGRTVWDGVILDITGQVEAARTSREQTERLAVALECAEAGLWDWDFGSARLTWSDSLWRLFGFDVPLTKPSLSMLNARIEPEDREGYWEAVNGAANAAAPLYVEFRFRRPDGTLRWAASIGRVFPDDDGSPRRMTGITIDITEQKRIREELRQAKEEAERANIAKSKFLAAASHDLRQPVQSLLFFIHVLKERLTGHDTRPLVQTMEQALDALKGLLDGILDLSKLDAGVVEPAIAAFPIATLLDRLRTQYTGPFAAKGLTLTVRPSAAVVRSDPTLLGRILSNLLENAGKYTQTGRVLVAVRPAGRDAVRVEVWDTGAGIPADQREAIFDEFVQIGNPERDRAHGLGLGLAIVRRLSALLDHPVRVRSTPGRGSVFSVEVPRAAVPPSPDGADGL
ncbi:PAS domain S-box-containing protein [Azospirillum fermentarium]|uniref:sensor histidine kinase n=1 Tax=Azospirillum fermentarium TaxID=1233114 RepID=UPI0022272010|nr:ATP-binding protein [Azospirillum fermentarium]MCW2248414.1 PAS domain S-box-containing protein [Azospirillum fermentarium]